MPVSLSFPKSISMPTIQKQPIELGTQLNDILAGFTSVRRINDNGSPEFVLASSDSSKSASLVISSEAASAALRAYQRSGKLPSIGELQALAAKAPTDTFVVSDVAHANEAWAPAPFTTEDRIGFDSSLKASYLADTVLPRNGEGENQGQTVVRARGNTHYPVVNGARTDEFASYFSDHSSNYSGGDVKIVGLRDLNGNQGIDAGERRTRQIPSDGTIVTESDLWSAE